MRNATTMRVFICFQGTWESFNVPPDQTVGAMKQMVKECFHVQLSDDNHHLELIYSGASLQNSWALCDVGITSGSAIRCHVKREQEPVMFVFNAVTGETFPIMGSMGLLNKSVARLKTEVSEQSSFPVSSFRLSTPAGIQLYDCNRLRDYDITVGSVLRLDTWDGWVEHLRGCLLGDRVTVQSHLSEKRPVMRFQLRVALYIAASLGHLELTGWLLEKGVRADEPVGVHPYRQWCHQTAHRDTGKCPVHTATERNQLLILKLFIANNILNLACQDPKGHDPLKIALRHGHRDCVHYLVGKLNSVVSRPNISMPMRIYIQIKRWVSLGQKRVASSRFQHMFKGPVGDLLLVDGFNQTNMSSKTRKEEISKSRTEALSISNFSTTRASLHPQSKPPMRASVLQIKPKHKRSEGRPMDEISNGVQRLCRSRFSLPPISKESVPRQVLVGASSHTLNASLESFSHRCGRTPRENAVFCLTIASTFTEKPWLKQLGIARTLARKHFRTMS